ncbi:MAG: glycosyltransferase [Actinomycetes bacterium]
MTNLIMVAAGWLLGWWAFGRPTSVDALPGSRRATSAPHSAATERPAISLIIPARNEATSLPLLLSDLASARPTGAQVMVVDDHSTDDTAALAAAFDFVRVIAAPQLPAGWTGKSWACATGAAAASGDVLVFIDADVRVSDGALDRLIDEHERVGGLVSVQPWHRTVRPYERLSALFNVVALMGTGAGSRAAASGAFGPLLVTSRADYELAGGHEAVRAEVVDDLALARQYREAGRPVHLYTGGRAVQFRMYPDGVRSMLEGWTKNFASGAGTTAPLRLGATVVWVTSLGGTVGVFADALNDSVPLAVGPLVYVLFVAQIGWMFRQSGSFGRLTALVYPALMVFFVVVFARSTWRTYVRRSVAWRGRLVPLRASRP